MDGTHRREETIGGRMTIRIRVNVWYDYHMDVRRDTLRCLIEVELCAKCSFYSNVHRSWLRTAYV